VRTPPTDRRARLARWTRLLFVIAVAVAFARVLMTNTDELRDIDLDVTPGWLALAAPISLLAGVLLPLAWRQIVDASGHTVDAGRSVRIWWMAQTGRYLPTGAAAFASRAVMTAREEVPKTVTVATMAVEMVLLVGVSAMIALVALPASSVAWWARSLLLAGGVAGLVAGPGAVRWLSARVPRLDPHRRGGWSRRELYRAEALVAANALSKSAAFVLLSAGLVPVHERDIAVLVGALNGGAVLGTIGITPAGLGVREGVVAGILSGRFGLGDAAALAIALRVWEILFECVWLVIVQHPIFRPAREPLTEAGT